MIRLEGSYTLAARREQVWPFIFDPQTLIGLIPGCQSIGQVSPGEYRGQVQVSLASMSGTYDTCVKVLSHMPPESCRFEGEISGPTGLIKGAGTFHLEEAEEKCLLQYRAEALVTGALSRLSPRFIEGAVNTFLKIGLAKLNQQVQRAAPSLE
jgi:2-furoyl-CoA dehydrogenase large subunit